MTGEIWQSVRERLRTKIGNNHYVTWIEPLQFGAIEGGILTFRVQSRFVADWVERYFRDAIIEGMTAEGVDVRRLSFTVEKADATGAAATAPAATSQGSAAPIEAPAMRAQPQGEGQDQTLAGSPLDDRFTFDSFVVGKPNELAHAAAQRVSEGDSVAFNPLVLYGGVGLGKTHLMHAIAWRIKARDPEARVLYLSAERFMNSFVTALRDRRMMDFKGLFRSVNVLMVDDLQFLAGKDSTQEEFFHTFNTLVDQRKQIIISSDDAPGEIQGLQQRIVSRLQSGLVVDVHPTSYELRLGILQRKLQYKMREFSGAQLGEGVLELLAARITSNVRELEGGLNRVLAQSTFKGQVIDVDEATDCVRDLLKIQDRRASVEEIQRKVAEHFNIRMADLLSAKRQRIYARPRQVAMYLAKEMTDRSLLDIARRFGGRDHTTIMHGVKKIEALRHEDTQMSEDLDILRRALKG